MCTKSVIIGDIRREHPLEMPFVEHDDMIEHMVVSWDNRTRIDRGCQVV